MIVLIKNVSLFYKNCDIFMMNKKWFPFYNIYLIQVKINEHFQKLN